MLLLSNLIILASVCLSFFFISFIFYFHYKNVISWHFLIIINYTVDDWANEWLSFYFPLYRNARPYSTKSRNTRRPNEAENTESNFVTELQIIWWIKMYIQGVPEKIAQSLPCYYFWTVCPRIAMFISKCTAETAVNWHRDMLLRFSVRTLNWIRSFSCILCSILNPYY